MCGVDVALLLPNQTCLNQKDAQLWKQTLSLNEWLIEFSSTLSRMPNPKKKIQRKANEPKIVPEENEQR